MSSLRIVSYNLDDLVVDPDGVIEAVNNACTHRHEHFRVSGVCQLEQNVFFSLTPLLDKEPLLDYILVTVEDISHDGFVSMLQDRWAAGFDMIGALQLYETTALLFAKPAK
jgi:hypothetical protein